MSRFTLDEDKARGWIARAMWLNPATELQLDEDYNVKDEAGDGHRTSDLVYYAQVAGIIADAQAQTEPFAPRLAFQFMADDGSGPGYEWVLRVTLTPLLCATKGFNDLCELAGADETEVTGAELALAVLQEAVSTGNEIAGGLAAYAAQEAGR